MPGCVRSNVVREIPVYGSLTERQRSRNHRPRLHVKCKAPTFARREDLNPEEVQDLKAASSRRFLRSQDRARDRVSDKAQRWTIAQLRKAPRIAFPDRSPAVLDRLIEGLIVPTHRAFERGDLVGGLMLGRFVDLVGVALDWQDPTDDCFDDDFDTPEGNRHSAQGWGAKLIQGVLADLAIERRAAIAARGGPGPPARVSNRRETSLRIVGARTEYDPVPRPTSRPAARPPGPEVPRPRGFRVQRAESRRGLDATLQAESVPSVSELIRRLVKTHERPPAPAIERRPVSMRGSP